MRFSAWLNSIEHGRCQTTSDPWHAGGQAAILRVSLNSAILSETSPLVSADAFLFWAPPHYSEALRSSSNSHTLPAICRAR